MAAKWSASRSRTLRIAAATPYAKRTVLGSIEDESTWEAAGCGFDCVVFADVLEHLRDPWAVLRRCREALRSGGHVVASIPNVAYYRVREHLADGPFRLRTNGHS